MKTRYTEFFRCESEVLLKKTYQRMWNATVSAFFFTINAILDLYKMNVFDLFLQFVCWIEWLNQDTIATHCRLPSSDVNLDLLHNLYKLRLKELPLVSLQKIDNTVAVNQGLAFFPFNFSLEEWLHMYPALPQNESQLFCFFDFLSFLLYCCLLNRGTFKFISEHKTNPNIFCFKHWNVAVEHTFSL